MPVTALRYADFDIYASNPAYEAILDLTAPIVGTGSLLVRNVGTPGGTTALNFLPKATATAQGARTGRLRALVRDQRDTTAQSFGLTCYQSQRDITSSGQAFALSWSGPGGGLILRLMRITNGMNTGSWTAVATYAIPAPQQAEIAAIELFWSVGNEALGGFTLTASYGLALDFSDLAQVMLFQEPNAALWTPVGEGGFVFAGGAGSPLQVRFDQMLFEEEC